MRKRAESGKLIRLSAFSADGGFLIDCLDAEFGRLGFHIGEWRLEPNPYLDEGKMQAWKIADHSVG
jgi:hypothetical protein